MCSITPDRCTHAIFNHRQRRPHEWFLFNVCPDIRQQIYDTPDLTPGGAGERATAIAGCAADRCRAPTTCRTSCCCGKAAPSPLSPPRSSTGDRSVGPMLSRFAQCPLVRPAARPNGRIPDLSPVGRPSVWVHTDSRSEQTVWSKSTIRPEKWGRPRPNEGVGPSRQNGASHSADGRFPTRYFVLYGSPGSRLRDDDIAARRAARRHFVSLT